MLRSLSLVMGLLSPFVSYALSPYSADVSFRPTEGMWWSSAKPGTGVGFNVDSEGRWFAAIYLYDEHGQPTFLTMQGESLAYGPIERPPGVPWAVALSPLIHSDGGQCLACPWSEASTSDTGQDGEIRFFDRTHAELRVGEWTLQLTPLPVSTGSPTGYISVPTERHYIFSGRVDPAGQPHVAVIRLTRTGVLGNWAERVDCVDCRTVDESGAVDPDGDASFAEALQNMAVVCRTTFCFLRVSPGHTITLFGDKNNQEFAGVDPRPGPPGSPASVIKLYLLDEGWRP